MGAAPSPGLAGLGLGRIGGSRHGGNNSNANGTRKQSLRSFAFAVPIEAGFIAGLC